MRPPIQPVGGEMFIVRFSREPPAWFGEAELNLTAESSSLSPIANFRDCPWMKLKIVQAGDPILRRTSSPLTPDQIRSASLQQLIALMRDTMRDAPGVGLAAPQIGESIQLAVIEDRTEYMKELSQDQISERQRSSIDFHVIINPIMSISGDSSAEFFEGCLSISGFAALVRRSVRVTVNCLNENAEPVTIEAEGWYARILQHEIDHLNGTLYIDRMETRSFATAENINRFWRGQTIEQVHPS